MTSASSSIRQSLTATPSTVTDSGVQPVAVEPQRRGRARRCASPTASRAPASRRRRDRNRARCPAPASRARDNPRGGGRREWQRPVWISSMMGQRLSRVAAPGTALFARHDSASAPYMRNARLSALLPLARRCSRRPRRDRPYAPLAGRSGRDEGARHVPGVRRDEGARGGQPEYDIAAQYVAAQFYAAGLKPGGRCGQLSPARCRWSATSPPTAAISS